MNILTTYRTNRQRRSATATLIKASRPLSQNALSKEQLTSFTDIHNVASMTRFSTLASLLALSCLASAQCGSSPDVSVDGSDGAYVATAGSTEVYSGADYLAAIQAAVNAASSGQTIAVIASGSIGAGTITIDSGKTFEGCGTIDVALRSGHGAIEVLNAADVHIPFLSMTGNPYFGLRYVRKVQRT